VRAARPVFKGNENGVLIQLYKSLRPLYIQGKSSELTKLRCIPVGLTTMGTWRLERYWSLIRALVRVTYLTCALFSEELGSCMGNEATLVTKPRISSSRRKLPVDCSSFVAFYISIRRMVSDFTFSPERGARAKSVDLCPLCDVLGLGRSLMFLWAK